MGPALVLVGGSLLVFADLLVVVQELERDVQEVRRARRALGLHPATGAEAWRLALCPWPATRALKAEPTRDDAQLYLLKKR